MDEIIILESNEQYLEAAKRVFQFYDSHLKPSEKIIITENIMDAYQSITDNTIVTIASRIAKFANEEYTKLYHTHSTYKNIKCKTSRFQLYLADKNIIPIQTDVSLTGDIELDTYLNVFPLFNFKESMKIIQPLNHPKGWIELYGYVSEIIQQRNKGE